MSTKIFVHKAYKVKAPKPPDTDLDRLFAEAVTKREAARDRKQQNRRIMAQLRNEELYQRAAKVGPPPPPPVETFHCRYCWGMETCATILGSNTKVLDRFYRAVVYDRKGLLDVDWMDRVHRGLEAGLKRSAKWMNVPLTDEELLKIAVRTCERSIEALENLQEERRQKREILAHMAFLGELRDEIQRIPKSTRLSIRGGRGHQCVAEEITK